MVLALPRPLLDWNRCSTGMERQRPCPLSMSTETIYQAVLAVCRRRLDHRPEVGGLSHLDMGAGRGRLTRLIQEEFKTASQACDCNVQRFAPSDIPVRQVDLNAQTLLYPENSFDLITCTEVIEHLEDYRRLVREIFRLLKPGGLVILTSPNILNVKSRLRFFCSGFYNLFGPLPVCLQEVHQTSGHINPITYFYLAHALLNAGFSEIEVDIDKMQRTSIFLTIIFAFPLVLGWLAFLRAEKYRYQTFTPENWPHVARHFSWQVLTGRTIIVSARKSG